MVDFHNPVVIEEDAFAVVKFWDVVNGIFIWEFLVTLDYEWSVIRRRRQYKWSILIYSLTRVSTLIAVSLNMLGSDASKSVNCQLWVIFELIFAYVGFAAASLLIVIRIIAIWDRNRLAVAIAMSAWLTGTAFLIYGITRLHATWAPTQGVCAVENIQSSKDTIIGVLITDVVLLLTMLVGLIRLRQWGTKSALWQLLWKQGLIWLLLATVAEGTSVVFMILNLNDPFTLMFETPALVVMSIAATRLHRSLTGFYSTSIFSCDISQIGSGRRTASTDPRRNSAASIPLDQLHVAGRKTSEGYAPAHPGHSGSIATSIGTECLSQGKSLMLAIDNDLENGVKSG